MNFKADMVWINRNFNAHGINVIFLAVYKILITNLKEVDSVGFGCHKSFVLKILEDGICGLDPLLFLNWIYRLFQKKKWSIMEKCISTILLKKLNFDRI